MIMQIYGRTYFHTRYSTSSVAATPAQKMTRSCALFRSITRITDLLNPSDVAASSTLRCVD